MAFCDLPSDHHVMVTCTYIVAVLPWTVLPLWDPIHRHWKSYRTTRRKSILYFLVSMLPYGLLIPYAILQGCAQEQDTKELLTAIVAMIASVWNLVRSVRGLFALQDVAQMWDAVDFDRKEHLDDVRVSNALVDNDWPGEAPRVPYITNFLMGRSEVRDLRSRLCIYGLWTIWMVTNPRTVENHDGSIPRGGHRRFGRGHVISLEPDDNELADTANLDDARFVSWWQERCRLKVGTLFTSTSIEKKNSSLLPPAAIAKTLVKVLKCREHQAHAGAELKKRMLPPYDPENQSGITVGSLETSRRRTTVIRVSEKGCSKAKRMGQPCCQAMAKFELLGTRVSLFAEDESHSNLEGSFNDLIKLHLCQFSGYDICLEFTNVRHVSFEKIRFLTRHEVDEQLSKLPEDAQDGLNWVDVDVLQEWAVHLQLNKEQTMTTLERMALAMGLPRRCSEMIEPWLNEKRIPIEGKFIAFVVILQNHYRPGDRPKIVSFRALRERLQFIARIIDALLEPQGQECLLVDDILRTQDVSEGQENCLTLREILHEVLGLGPSVMLSSFAQAVHDALKLLKEHLKDTKKAASLSRDDDFGSDIFRNFSITFSRSA